MFFVCRSVLELGLLMGKGGWMDGLRDGVCASQDDSSLQAVACAVLVDHGLQACESVMAHTNMSGKGGGVSVTHQEDGT